MRLSAAGLFLLTLSHSIAAQWESMEDDFGAWHLTGRGDGGSLVVKLTAARVEVQIRPSADANSWNQTVAVGIDGATPRNERWPQGGGGGGSRFLDVPDPFEFLTRLLTAKSSLSVRAYPEGASRSHLMVFDVSAISAEDRAQLQGRLGLLKMRKAATPVPRRMLLR